MSETFDIWRLLAGLGIFLFGIYLMEDSIKELAGKAFKTLIRRYTETRFSAVLSGTFSTAILQSSSAVNLMVLAFVGAGIMSLGNAMGVILGANIGTTFTAWIVAFFGFKISIESFALPLIAIGGLGLIFFSSSPRYLNVSKLLIGFGFLFHGLDYMKTSVDQITQLFDVAILAGYGTGTFLLAGIILTAIMQSSSATIAIILASINGGILGFESGAAMVIGANVGTTVTVVLGSVGGIPIKKRVALGHLTFNLVTGIVVFLLLPVVVWFIQVGFGWQENVIMGIALFHTLFNIIGIMLFLPFITQLTDKLNTLFQEPRRILTHYIQNTSPDIPDAAQEAFKKEIVHQFIESRRYLIILYDLKIPKVLSDAEEPALQHRIMGTADQVYGQLKELHGNIFEYYARINTTELEPEESKKMEEYLRSSRSIMNATKNLKEVRSDLEDFELANNSFLNSQLEVFQNRLSELFNDLEPLLISEKEPDKVPDQILKQVDTYDRQSIRASSEAAKRGALNDLEATSMVMINRLFTQSSRMLVLSLENLLPISESQTKK
ncbi:Na/Pi symporter [Aliifodinibius salicampi]|uniref:Na/Pi symporter n=1 Tax=Fodinibius salicampi TaxID=1920655 RepID=A0ABT3PWD5_9BACT|nr:Na/Pi symporter [Fodinibius salicampi]MCW9712158.1 Na/Pi symporter [Fodinibius salicampi]